MNKKDYSWLWGVIIIIIVGYLCGNMENAEKESPPTVSAVFPTPTENHHGCTSWKEFRPAQKTNPFYSTRACVYGDLYDQQEVEDENGAIYVLVRFSEDPSSLYVLQEYDVKARRGDCITAVGALSYDRNGIPFINIDGEVEKC